MDAALEHSVGYYLFSDACPTDWLTAGSDDAWHTIANVVLGPFAPAHIEVDYRVALETDAEFSRYVANLTSSLGRDRLLRKWKTGPGYQARFRRAFAKSNPSFISVNALSFQEGVLRAAKPELLRRYNNLLGGVEGRPIGFAESMDARGRGTLCHSFVTGDGFLELRAPEEQMLVLLLLSWFVADQSFFYRRWLLGTFGWGMGSLKMHVISDTLSGDNHSHDRGEQILRNLLDADKEMWPVQLSVSPPKSEFSAEIIADNIAGWLNGAISGRSRDCATDAIAMADCLKDGWRILTPNMCGASALSTVRGLLADEKWGGT